MKIAIIGSGPAGLTSAIFAQRGGHEVIILEKNDKIGKKLLMTGNGKCNYFNSDMNINHYYSENKDLIKDIINEKNINDILTFLEKLGIFPNIKKGYFYPRCNKASFIKDTLNEEIKLLNIKIEYNFEVIDIVKENQFIIKSKDKQITADKLIVATGSKAYPNTGSNGKGYEIAYQFNHSIIKPLPALVPLKCEGNYFNIWKGARSEAIVSLYENDIFLKEEQGEIQFTDYGISGICIFNLSSIISKGLNNNKEEKICINFLPFISVNSIDKAIDYLTKQSEIITGRKLQLFLQTFVEEKIAKTILKVSNIDENKYFDELNKKEKYNLAQNLISFKIKVIEPKGFEYSQVCAGGVPLNEINTTTMESKKQKDLYIVGELLDVNGDCGGYNLAFAFISGMLAGKGI